MSSIRKKTLAQMRAENEQRERDGVEGARLAVDVIMAFAGIDKKGYNTDLDYETLNGLLAKANRSCELLQSKPEAEVYRVVFHMKAHIYTGLGKHTLALDALRRADEAFIVAEGKGLLTTDDHVGWRKSIVRSGVLYLDAHQPEAAKCCFYTFPVRPPVIACTPLKAWLGVTRCAMSGIA